MTCREFKDRAADLTLWQLSRTQDEGILNHARQCESCGTWLQEQHTLAASLQTLQARTAGLGAGAHVERAVLRAFRQHAAGISAVADCPAQATEAMATDVARDSFEHRLPAAPSSAPFALRLSHFFEIGAYIAVAAAVVVVLFLGLRLLPHSSNAPMQGQTAPQSARPGVEKAIVAAQPAAASQPDSARVASVRTGTHSITTSRTRGQAAHSSSGAPLAAEAARTEESQSDSDADDGYVALMFCDPLSCSSGTQVVRMELPASPTAGSQSLQPQVADVVVGYDGVVRAVRLVN